MFGVSLARCFGDVERPENINKEGTIDGSHTEGAPGYQTWASGGRLASPPPVSGLEVSLYCVPSRRAVVMVKVPWDRHQVPLKVLGGTKRPPLR